MINALPSIFTGLIGLVPLVAQWIGVLVMRDQRTRAWWTMMGGTAIQTLGTLIARVAGILLFTAWGASIERNPDAMILYSKMGAFAGLAASGGCLVFATGFAIHCVTRRAAREREQQLEAMTTAMAEELRVLRERAS